MTSGQLRNKMRRLREEKEEEAEESGELNLVPYLDIVTNIVIFLLASITTYQMALSNVNVSAPIYGSGGGDSQGEPPLNLTVTTTLNGFTIAASGAVLYNEQTQSLPTIPKAATASELPWSALEDYVEKIKARYPDEHTITIQANPDVPYETVVKTMDTCRQDSKGKVMFPDVSLSAGVATF
jgi:biopolymer transport protein ExbD